jgi:cell division protein FtsW
MAEQTIQRTKNHKDQGGKTSSRRVIRLKKQEGTRYFDYQLIFYMVILLAFGMVMLYSASSYTASLSYGDAAYWVKRQLIFSLGGLFIMFLVSKLDYHFWVRHAPIIYIIAFGLNILVIFIGVSRNGSSRWIPLGPIQLQPSELAKAAAIVFFARLFEEMGSNVDKAKKLMWPFFMIVLLLIPIAATNLSTAVILAGIWFFMLLVVSKNRKVMLTIVGIGLAAVAGFITFAGYRSDRIKIWRDPTKYEKGYQTLQGLYAIGSGGIFGKGLGAGMQKRFVPEARNDMIFSLICEELGLFGAVILIILFILFLYRLYFIATNAADLSGSLIVVGIMAQVAIQVVLNIAVVTNTIPNTGITLPFISYGGSALIILMGEIGIALNVSRSINFYA